MKLTREELRLNYNEACNAYLMAFYEKLRERREKEPDKVHGKDPKMKNQVKFVKMTIAKAREYYGGNMCVRTVMGLSKSFDASLLHEGVWDVTYATDGVTDPVAVEVTHLI